MENISEDYKLTIMKELSIEEKAHRYDEAIKTARKINSGEGVAAPPDWTICEVIFPELKESEDERIRKEMIETLKNEAHEFPSSIIAEKSKSWIAWLEKQEKYFKEESAKWSKEDEEMYNRRVSFIPQHLTAESYTACINWLKFLKDRYAWKPSDEQMRVLDLAIRCGINRGTTEETTLVSLFNDLKKLREE